jgi:hypothetical protein
MGLLALIKGLGVGAGLMYFFDPDRGKTRRAKVRDQAVKTLNQVGDTVESKTRQLANQARGMLAETGAALTGPVPAGHKGRFAPADRWPPETRLAVSVAGSWMAVSGARRGGFLGGAACLLGLGMLLRSLSQSEVSDSAEACFPATQAEEEREAADLYAPSEGHHPRTARTH